IIEWLGRDGERHHHARLEMPGVVAEQDILARRQLDRRAVPRAGMQVAEVLDALEFLLIDAATGGIHREVRRRQVGLDQQQLVFHVGRHVRDVEGYPAGLDLGRAEHDALRAVRLGPQFGVDDLRAYGERWQREAPEQDRG